MSVFFYSIPSVSSYSESDSINVCEQDQLRCLLHVKRTRSLNSWSPRTKHYLPISHLDHTWLLVKIVLPW